MSGNPPALDDSEVMMLAISLIEARGWRPGTSVLRSDDAPVCLLEAIAEAQGADAWWRAEPPESLVQVCRGRTSVPVDRRLSSCDQKEGRLMDVYLWNDCVCRSSDRAVAALRAAIALEEGRHDESERIARVARFREWVRRLVRGPEC